MLYSALHDAGVIHNDVSWRHILRQGNSLRLIDFERAIRKKDDDGDDWWKEACGHEMWMLDAVLREA